MRAGACLAVVVGAAYLVWRAGWTLNHGAPWLSIPLLATEVHGYLTFLLLLLMCWKVSPLPRGDVPRTATADFFIPTYNEPFEILSLTIAGAAAIRWPHETYVLDDGRRPWVRDLCERSRVHYVTRPDNKGAKAGNINHALTVSTGTFIGIVDADFVPAPEFFDELLGYFEDETVAIVQAPQEFYNVNSFQHMDDGTDWHEQTMFYRVIQPGKNHSNSVFWCGSPSALRRSALEAAGGVATETVTEDLHTTLKLHCAGWRTVFHNRQVARGLAPEDYNAFVVQRLRWAQGSMQVIRREWRKGGLSIGQRINYVASTTTYFDAFRKLIMLMAVPAILFSDELPISYPGLSFLIGWGIYFGVSQGANILLGRGYYRWWQTEMFDLMKMYAFLQASLTLVVEGALHFRVTPKANLAGKKLHPLAFPHVAMASVYLAALFVGSLRVGGWWLDTENILGAVGALAWGTLIAVVLLLIAWRTYDHVSQRRVYRMPIQRRGWADWDGITAPVTVIDLNLNGAAFITDHEFMPGDQLVLSGELRKVRGNARVCRVEAMRDSGGERFIVGVEFLNEFVERRVVLAHELTGIMFSSEQGEPVAEVAQAPLTPGAGPTRKADAA